MNRKTIYSKQNIFLLFLFLMIIAFSIFTVNRTTNDVSAIVSNKKYITKTVPSDDIPVQIDLKNKKIKKVNKGNSTFDTKFKLDTFKHEKSKYEISILLDYQIEKKGILISNIKYEKVADTTNTTQTAFLSAKDENGNEVSFEIGIKDNEFFLSIPDSELKNSKIITVTFHGLNKISYKKI